MRRHLTLLVASAVLMTLMSATCKKPLVCIGDCYDLKIYGTTLSATTGTPVGNVPFTLYRRATGIFSTKRKIIDFQSDASGTIIATASIDTSALRSNYYFYAEMRDSPKWVPADDDLPYLYDITRSPFDNYQSKVYERKDLTLKLQHVLPGDFTPFSVSCHYGANHGSIPWIASQPQDIKETTKVVGMASGLWAYIDISRTDVSGNSTLTRDSVFMTPGSSPVPPYIVKY